MTTVDAQGRNLVCAKVKGKLRWKLASTPPPTPTPADGPGATCATSGQLAPMRGMGIAICKSGRWA
ncbi:MAG: hypothetical protein FJW80_08715 [Actinobacteria bacterium]|nr:hypothetical protein [Actinomycetota bacterium]